MSRNKKAVGLLGALILTLALLPALDQPARQGVDDGPGTAELLMFVAMSIEGGDVLKESSMLGGLMGAVVAGLAEIGGAFGWFSAATASVIGGAGVVTMGFAA